MMPVVASLLALSFAATDAHGFCKPEPLDADELGYFVGTYDVVGRDYWTGRPFAGRATVTLSDTLKVTWQDARGNISGIARTERCGADQIRILHLVYREHGADMDGLCHFSSELDNYARITCQLERAINGAPKPRGLLAFFYRHTDAT
jgi:hypothetical protein